MNTKSFPIILFSIILILFAGCSSTSIQPTQKISTETPKIEFTKSKLPSPTLTPTITITPGPSPTATPSRQTCEIISTSEGLVISVEQINRVCLYFIENIEQSDKNLFREALLLASENSLVSIEVDVFVAAEEEKMRQVELVWMEKHNFPQYLIDFISNTSLTIGGGFPGGLFYYLKPDWWLDPVRSRERIELILYEYRISVLNNLLNGSVNELQIYAWLVAGDANITAKDQVRLLGRMPIDDSAKIKKCTFPLNELEDYGIDFTSERYNCIFNEGQAAVRLLQVWCPGDSYISLWRALGIKSFSKSIQEACNISKEDFYNIFKQYQETNYVSMPLPSTPIPTMIP